MKKPQSTYARLGLPLEFGVILLTLSLILLLGPYMAGKDFGTFKIPAFNSETKQVLKIIGPILFMSIVGLFIPIWREKYHSKESLSEKVFIDYVNNMNRNVFRFQLVDGGYERSTLSTAKAYTDAVSSGLRVLRLQ